MKISPEQLNARAFGEDPVETKVETKVESTEKSVAPQAETEDKAASEPEESVVEEQKVPYSRLKTVVERARVAEQKALDAERRLQEVESRRETRTSNEPYEKAISDRIIKLYGDSDTAKQIIELELARQKELEEIAERKAYEALDKRENTSRSEIEANERVLEERLEDFTITLGRDLTKNEEDELLAIADQYSPTGEDGKYLSGEPLPLDRAWEIYEMKQASKGQSSKRSRSEATALTGSKSDGESDVKEGDSESWFPGRWRNRFGK